MADPIEILKETSTTFYLPTMHLTGPLHDALLGSYLSLRVIDEIEDHPTLTVTRKRDLLMAVSEILQSQFQEQDFLELFADEELHPATHDLYRWLEMCPPSIAPRVWDATSTMATRMSSWLVRRVRTASDLDRFCFAFSGAVGLLLSDIWAWHDGTRTDRTHALALGRAIQAVNIFVDQEEDATNGKSFKPQGWGDLEILKYAADNLLVAGDYVSSIPPGQPREFMAAVVGLSWSAVDTAVTGQALATLDLAGIAANCLATGTVADHSHTVAQIYSGQVLNA